MDHPDPTGPEEAEEPTAARDGVENGGSIADAAAEDEPIEKYEEPITGDGGQLSLGGLGVRRRASITSHVSFGKARREINGRLDPERDHSFVVRARVAGHDADYTRADETPDIDGVASTQRLRLLEVKRLDPRIETIARGLATLTEEEVEEILPRLEAVVSEHLGSDRVPALA